MILQGHSTLHLFVCFDHILNNVSVSWRLVVTQEGFTEPWEITMLLVLLHWDFVEVFIFQNFPNLRPYKNSFLQLCRSYSWKFISRKLKASRSWFPPVAASYACMSSSMDSSPSNGGTGSLLAECHREGSVGVQNRGSDKWCIYLFLTEKPATFTL